MPEIAVELLDVVKRFSDVTAVDHISIRIQDGEFFSLLGPSGCGKTTTLRMIAGLELPTSGEIYIGGKAQGYLPAYQRPVNTVFQNYALFPHMNVFKNVAFGLEMQKYPKADIQKRVHQALELVQLSDFGNRRPNQLSGGQQQRIALARALVNRPKVLLLDEPLGALDLKLRKAMQLELKNLQSRVGITFIYVTHDQEEALTMSDRIAVMENGQVFQVGSPEEIYESPANRFVADFIGETNFISGVIAEMGAPIDILLANDAHIFAGWAENGISRGERIILSIRPEKIRLYPDEDDMDITGFSITHGEIRQVIYSGVDTRFAIDIGNGSELIVRLPNALRTGRSFQLGNKVLVSWDPAFARVYKE
ncbi:MAG: ABC transporter ATP-binding protein [Anaerolineales bacterium]|nr:ABC transporter ATP-binding protein [Anaerolineales bacterium]